jgi:hypothetical protein
MVRDSSYQMAPLSSGGLHGNLAERPETEHYEDLRVVDHGADVKVAFL